MKNKIEKISEQDILDLWKTTQQPTGVYIHSPFCKEQCTYCTFKGTIFNKHEWKQYYEEYLPKMIEFYNDILSSSQIIGYFFGGGTPTLMSPSEMRNLFDLIPNFKSQKNKLMEMHVCDWNKEQLDVLREYNFNIVTACIQTFDRDALKKYKRRVPKNTDVVCEHIRYANSIGLKTNSDLIYLDTGNIAKDINRLMEDMQLLADNNISEITITTIFDEEGKFDNIVTAATELFLDKNPKYAIYNTFRPVGQGGEVGVKRNLTLRMFKRDEDCNEIFHWIVQLEEMTKWNHSSLNIPNILGIGSYNNYKDTFSTIEDRIEYKEVGNLNFPEFYITYNKLDYKIKDMIASFYEELDRLVGEEPPDGIKFHFSSQIQTENGIGVNTKNKKVTRKLNAEVLMSKTVNNHIHSDYAKKLNIIWPRVEEYLTNDRRKSEKL